ncbi:hypothetical protein AOR13_1338 [Alteromonas stellipolaris LMG 21856]|nr:hypothetical protein AOR13_1338 [Alteromonas stellipolaris LMG 21856]
MVTLGDVIVYGNWMANETTVGVMLHLYKNTGNLKCNYNAS